MNPADRIACRETYIRKYGSREATCPVCGACYLTPKGGRSIARCIDCLVWSHALKGRAHLLVAKEIKAGRLPRPASLKCADCESEAEVYDHRDYYEPLKVDPVCMSCNAQRGPAFPFIEMGMKMEMLARRIQK